MTTFMCTHPFMKWASRRVPAQGACRPWKSSMFSPEISDCVQICF